MRHPRWPAQAAEGGSDVAAEGGMSKEQLKALKALQVLSLLALLVHQYKS